MARLEAKDKVQWRAGDTPSSSHVRVGVIKEVLSGGICLVGTKVDGVTIVEEIRIARLKPVEPPAPVPKKQVGKSASGKGRKRAKKAMKGAEKAAEKPAAEKKAPAKNSKRSRKSKKKAA